MNDKIMLDTDMGMDCDDAGALALLHRIADKTDTEILAVTHCSSGISGAVTVKYINEYYGRPQIPVGTFRTRRFLEDEACVKYTKPLMEKYLTTHKMPEFQSSVKVLRKALSNQTDVTIVVIGMLNNIAELIKSEPDEFSELCGRELIEKSVKNMYVMGGNFVDKDFCEYNIRTDTESAVYTAENFPRPIVWCGFECGAEVKTGKHFLNGDDTNPVSFAYHIHCGYNVCEYRSWDLVTVFAAVFRNTPLLSLRNNLKVTFDDKGRTLVSPGGKDSHLTLDCTEKVLGDEINRFLY